MDNDVLLNIAPCGIFSFTDEGTLTFVNRTLLDKLSYTSEELTGQNVEKIFTLSTRIFYQTHLFPLLKLHGKADEIFLTLLSKNREHIPVLINALENKEGNSALNVCACITVHQRKQYEDEILLARQKAQEALNRNEELIKVKYELETGKQELDKQITELKYRNRELFELNELAAHDLQEPVRKISLYADILVKENREILSDQSVKSFAVIIKASERMRNVLTNLQEYLYISTSPIKKEQIDLNGLIESELSSVSALYPGVEFTKTVEKLATITADLKQLKILFHQLIINCFKFRSVERKLHIHITASRIQQNIYLSTEEKYQYGDFAVIRIEDNGKGFNPVYKDLIFRILKKLELQSEGLGFGLPLSKRIVENHLGSITCTAGLNKGAIFTVMFPFD